MNLSKEKLQTLAYNLNELCSDLDEHYDINNGGCCFVAACIAECLEKYDIEFSVLVYDCYENEFNEIDCSHYHYMIVFNDTIINNMSYCSGTLYTYVDSEMIFQHFNECSWNETYDTTLNDNVKKQIIDCFEQSLSEK